MSAGYLRFGLLLAAGLACCLGGAPPATSQVQGPLQVGLTLGRGTVQYWEEIPLIVALKNVGTTPLRVPKLLRHYTVNFEVVDARTGGAVQSTLRVFLLRIPPRLQELRPGETWTIDWELISAFGPIDPGAYQVRALYRAADSTLPSPPAALTVTELSPREKEARPLFEVAAYFGSRAKKNAAGREFLQRFPESIFAKRVRQEMQLCAIFLKDWATAVEMGEQLLRLPMWEGEREVCGMHYGQALWHLGRFAEAEAILRSIDRGEAARILKKLQEGSDRVID